MQPIEYHFHQSTIRAMVINDIPWFVMSDVLKALHSSDVTRPLDSLDDYEKSLQQVGDQEIWCVSESAVFRIADMTGYHKAPEFVQWFNYTLLPRLRRDTVMQSKHRMLICMEDGKVTGSMDIEGYSLVKSDEVWKIITNLSTMKKQLGCLTGDEPGNVLDVDIIPISAHLTR
jgi:prophage antirepressor-like protein